MDRILILNLTRMGDLVQTGPLIQGLRQRHPEAHLALLTLRAFAGIGRLLPDVDEWLELDQDSAVGLLLDPEAVLGFQAGWFLERLGELRGEGWDLVVNLTHSRDSALLASWLSRGEVRGIAAHPDGVLKVEHDWSRYFFCVTGNRALNHINLVDMYRRVGGLAASEGGDLRLLVPAGARATATELLAGLPRPLVMIQPGASRENRRWSVARLGEAMRGIHAACGAGFVVAGAGNEAALCAQVAGQVPELPLLDLAGRTGLAELAACAQACDLLVTNDTGTLHVAAAVGTPSVSLFFATALPWETGPWLPGCLVLQVEMDCAPCSHHVECPHVMCREAIPAGLVRDAALSVLAGGGLAPPPAEGWERVPEVRVWRTTRDSEGLQDLRLLGARPVRAEELAARAYRHLWTRTLGGQAVDPERFDADLAAWLRDWSPPEAEELARLRGLEGDLRVLEELAEAGHGLAAQAYWETSGGAPRVEVLSRVVEEMPRLDDRIFSHELSRPLLRPLGVLFRFEKEQLDAWQDIDTLGRAALETYERLGRRGQELRALLGRIPAVVEAR